MSRLHAAGSCATQSGDDPATGQAVRTVSSTGGTITKVYDKLGRLISYTDADGGTTRTHYDLLDRPVRVTDSVPSTVTHTYDHTIDPRGLATRTTDSVAGTVRATYDPDGKPRTEKLPGGYTVRETTNPDGSILERQYTRDSDGTVLYSDTVTENTHGQVVTHAGWSSQHYRYDKLGRLTEVEDTTETICTPRTYTFDQRTNRTSLRTATGLPGDACPTSAGTTTSYTYDTADRLTTSGHVYDAFGRTTAVPGHGTIAYHANDLVHRQTADGKRQTWTLDAAHRFRTWTVETNTGGTWTQAASKRNHYSGDGDNPSWIVENTTTGEITRNVDSASGDLAATTGASGDTVLQVTNIHGDVALQLPLTAGRAPVVLDHDEYGNPRTGQEPTRYGWLGAKQRSAETLTGLTLMGVRLYNPHTGRFLSIDPVYGGGDNLYGYPGDPINQYDLDGRHWLFNKKNLSRLGTGLAVAGMFGCGLCAAGSAVISLGIAAHDWRSGKRREAVIGGLTAFTWGAGRAASWGAKKYGKSISRKAPKGIPNRGRANKRARHRMAKKSARNYRVSRRVNRVDFGYGAIVAGRSVYGEYSSWRRRR
ncbi:hypothetical protein FNX48_005085 [Streptomyces sp. IF17]|nr:hypothetical protein [Streptomyces alkaliphilus]